VDVNATNKIKNYKENESNVNVPDDVSKKNYHLLLQVTQTPFCFGIGLTYFDRFQSDQIVKRSRQHLTRNKLYNANCSSKKEGEACHNDPDGSLSKLFLHQIQLHQTEDSDNASAADVNAQYKSEECVE
jgi:hypothetical protein